MKQKEFKFTNEVIREQLKQLIPKQYTLVKYDVVRGQCSPNINIDEVSFITNMNRKTKG
jgi:hypothetical protein